MTTNTDTHKCFTCGTPVDRYSAYCPACIAEQERRHGDERAAFDDFHRFADAVARHSARTCGR